MTIDECLRDHELLNRVESVLKEYPVGKDRSYSREVLEFILYRITQMLAERKQ